MILSYLVLLCLIYRFLVYLINSAISYLIVSLVLSCLFLSTSLCQSIWLSTYLPTHLSTSWTTFIYLLYLTYISYPFYLSSLSYLSYLSYLSCLCYLSFLSYLIVYPLSIILSCLVLSCGVLSFLSYMPIYLSTYPPMRQSIGPSIFSWPCNSASSTAASVTFPPGPSSSKAALWCASICDACSPGETCRKYVGNVGSTREWEMMGGRSLETRSP